MKKSNRQRVHSNYYVEIVFFCNNNNKNNNNNNNFYFLNCFPERHPKTFCLFTKKQKNKKGGGLSFSPRKASIERKRERERDVVVKQHSRRDGVAIVFKFFDGDGRVRLSRRPIRSSRFGCFRATDSNPKKELDCLDDAKIVRRFKLFRHVRSSRGVCYSREAGRD